MAEDRLHVQIVTANGIVYDHMASYVNVPLSEGSVGILPGHQSLLAAASDGPVLCRHDGNTEDYICIGNGILEVDKDRVNIMVRCAELAEDIDLARAIASKERAEKRIKDKADNIDHIRAQASLYRAIARIKTAELKNHKR